MRPKYGASLEEKMNKLATQSLFLLLTLGGGMLIGSLTGPDAWFAGLARPSFNPPGWVFGPVWSILYVLIAVAGSRTWLRDRKGQAMKLWWAQLVLNFLWSPVFFGAHRIDAALAIIVLLLAAIIAFIFAVRKQDKVAAWLFAPYAAWVSFALALNAAFLRING